MPRLHIDIFYCFNCGELCSQEHGTDPPTCCEAPMATIAANIHCNEGPNLQSLNFVPRNASPPPSSSETV